GVPGRARGGGDRRGAGDAGRGRGARARGGDHRRGAARGGRGDRAACRRACGGRGARRGGGRGRGACRRGGGGRGGGGAGGTRSIQGAGRLVRRAHLRRLREQGEGEPRVAHRLDADARQDLRRRDPHGRRDGDQRRQEAGRAEEGLPRLPPGEDGLRQRLLVRG